jgi:hypothetical protein
MTQKEALDILKTGRNVFLTGPAGSGKTYVLREYISYLRTLNARIGITASTGIAATHMGGVTIHSWSGIGIRDSLDKSDIAEIAEKQHVRKKLLDATVLIVDEISMLHHFRLDLVDLVLRKIKSSEQPFGGIQVVFCGDFFQLPPVHRSGEREALFAYHSEAWKNLDLKICYLEEQHRQNDEAFLKVLNAVRGASVTTEVRAILQNRFNQASKQGATRLYSHNRNVDTENATELQKIGEKNFKYEMRERGRTSLVEMLKKSCLAPANLELKIGAKVMFVKNNFDAGYVNGTLGIVEKCSYEEIKVRTTTGIPIDVERTSWVIEEDGKIKAEINQYPLRLAWAITIHKSQGMSLDDAEIDLSQFFEKGSPTKKIWFYQLNLTRNLGKGQPLSESDLTDFVKLQKIKADTENSWSVDIKNVDQKTFDLSVKNPNKVEEVSLREPKEILVEMNDLDKDTNKILNEIKKII